MTTLPPHQLAPLFRPLALSPQLTLANRIVLAPCTRNRATTDGGPTPGAIAHYADRAEAGLLITEATLIGPGVQGNIDIPGIFTPAHVRAWARVTEAVHRRDGRIFLQLWHPGRMGHSFFAGQTPRAPSAVLDVALKRAVGDRTLYNEEPRAMTGAEVLATLDAYVSAAQNAFAAGFDGVEIHGANGYLPEQFWRQHTNRRTDDWGGTTEKRARFLIELAQRLVAAVGAGRVGLRLSPAAYFSEMRHIEGDLETLDLILTKTSAQGLAYMHTGIVTDDPVEYLGGTTTEYLRARWSGVLIGNGGYTPGRAAQLVGSGACDLAAFGKLFLSNPDLVRRIRDGSALEPYSRDVLTALE